MRLVPAVIISSLLCMACIMVAGKQLDMRDADAGKLMPGPGEIRYAAPNSRYTDEKYILFVGNSYTYANDLPGMVLRIAESDTGLSTRLGIASVTKGGARLDQTWNDGIATKVLLSSKWDKLVLQEYSLWTISSINISTAMENADLWSKIAKENHTQIFLYGTWPDRGGSSLYIKNHPVLNNYASMLGAIHSRSPVLAQRLGATLIPVGDLWDNALKKNPDTILWGADSHHPASAGTYLAALGIYSALTGRTAESVQWHPSDINSDEAKFLRNIALSEY